MSEIGNVGEAIIASRTPRQRWEEMPRPLRYARPRLYPESMAWLKDLIIDEQESLLEDLGELRTKGRREDDEEINGLRISLEHAAEIMREINRAEIEFAGTREET